MQPSAQPAVASPSYLSATALAARIAAGEITALAALEACLARAAAVNDPLVQRSSSKLNAIIAWRVDAARAEAAAADRARAAGHLLGPLHGVPMTVKDSFDVAGLASTFGHPERADHVAVEDAVAVARLRAAGAILFGKTNVPKDLADWQSENALYGRTLNPWDTSRSPGGSSGGAAAALAAGLTCLELGSDIGGSIRMPAHFCGIYGHKPTFGVVPMRGHAMRPGAVASDISAAGPLARSAADLAVAMDLLAGADPADAPGWQLVMAREARTSPAGMRIAVITDDEAWPVDGAISAGLRQTADWLRDAGAEVTLDPPWPLPSRQMSALYVALLRGATSTRLGAVELERVAGQADGLAADDDSYHAQMLRGLSQRHATWLGAHARRHRLRQAWRDWFGRFDALICPVAPFAAFPHIMGVPKAAQRAMVDGAERPVSDAYFWLGIASVAYLPATTIPLTLSAEGLPLGAQIIVPEFCDARGIRLAGWLEQGFRGFMAPPLAM
jgi:amidase